jgi:DNA-binding Xre family transcriptional regulator
MLRWSATDLSEKAGVGSATIKRLEIQNGIPSVNTKTLVAIQQALEQAGIEFTGDPENAPGVRLLNK